MKGTTASAITKIQAVIVAVIVIAAAAIGAFYFLTIAPGPAHVPEYIKIGFPIPSTGALAGFAEIAPWVSQQVEEYVNNKWGGVYLSEYGRKVPIKVILRDTKSDSDLAASIAAELITKENINMMLALFSPAMTNPISAQCEKYGVPCVVASTTLMAWLSGAPYEWARCMGTVEIDYATLFFNLFDSVRNKVNRKIALICSDDADGRAFAESAKALADTRGYTIVDFVLVPPGTADFSSSIYKWKSAEADILTGNMLPTVFQALWRQCNEAGYKPKIAAISRALLFPSWVQAIGGDLPHGLISHTPWTRYESVSSITGQKAKEIISAWENYSGKQWAPVWGQVHAAFEVAIDSLKRAGSLDKAKIRDALVNTNLNTIMGTINYNAPLTPAQQSRYQARPEFIKYKNNYAIITLVGIQWVKGTKWPWEYQVIYNWEFPEIPETAKMFLLGEK